MFIKRARVIGVGSVAGQISRYLDQLCQCSAGDRCTPCGMGHRRRRLRGAKGTEWWGPKQHGSAMIWMGGSGTGRKGVPWYSCTSRGFMWGKLATWLRLYQVDDIVMTLTIRTSDWKTSDTFALSKYTCIIYISPTPVKSTREGGVRSQKCTFYVFLPRVPQGKKLYTT